MPALLVWPASPVPPASPPSPGGAGDPPVSAPVVGASEAEGPLTLYITLGPDGAFKVGTCAHCVVHEHGRPSRAWDAEGDRDLDFDRESLLAELAALGVEITDRSAYVCP